MPVRLPILADKTILGFYRFFAPGMQAAPLCPGPFAARKIIAALSQRSCELYVSTFTEIVPPLDMIQTINSQAMTPQGFGIIAIVLWIAPLSSVASTSNVLEACMLFFDHR